jgi:glycosyltransferase involved in cell wall biosynthesis
MRACDRPSPTLSIVVPSYNEEEVLPEASRRLEALLQEMIETGMVGPDSHVVFVDDGSTDGTWAIIQNLHERSTRIRGVKLSRNRGHQHALLAGLFTASGDIVVSIDADLQDDLDVMKEMVLAHATGADIVLGVRKSRSIDTPFKRITAQAYYRFLRWMNVDVVYNHADYRLLSQRAIEALRGYQETNLFLRGLVMHLGFKTAIVNYTRAGRLAGESKYSLGKMVALAVEGVTAFSTMPLRYITLLGFLVSLLSFLLGLWAFVAAVFLNNTIPGWASTVIPIYLICGVQMICLGIMGEYIGKTYLETKRRPRFIIETALPENVARIPATTAPDKQARPPLVRPEHARQQSPPR